MTDDFIKSLRADWAPEDAEKMVVRLRSRRWVPHALFATDLLGVVLMGVFGLIYAVLAARYRDLLFGLSAIAMLPVGLPLVAAGIRLRWRALAWEGETAEGLLQSRLRQLKATRRILNLDRVACLILFALGILVFAAALAGWVHEPRKVLLVIVTTWVLTGSCGVALIRWRLARVTREIAGCEALLRQFNRSVEEVAN